MIKKILYAYVLYCIVIGNVTMNTVRAAEFLRSHGDNSGFVGVISGMDSPIYHLERWEARNVAREMLIADLKECAE